MADAQYRLYIPVVAGNTGSSPQPTATPTDTPPVGGHVKIVSINYNPPGIDVDGEYVLLKNQGGSFNMQGWQLHDEANTTYTFPEFTLAVDAEVKVWTGTGANDNQNLYWNRNWSLWNNNGDTATLKDNIGNVVDTCTYPGGDSVATCP